MDMYCVPALAVLISFLGSDSLIAVVSVYPELQWGKKKKKPHSGKVPHMPLSCITVINKAKFLIYCTRAVAQNQLGTKHLDSPFGACLSNSGKFLSGELSSKTRPFLLVLRSFFL